MAKIPFVQEQYQRVLRSIKECYKECYQKRPAVVSHAGSCREQRSPVVSGYGEIEDHAGRSRGAKPYRSELLGMTGLARYREHAAGRADLRLQMLPQGSLAFCAQAARTLLHHRARDLRHARRGRAGARREREDMEMRQRARIDQIE